jgi:hypothetical protein
MKKQKHSVSAFYLNFERPSQRSVAKYHPDKIHYTPFHYFPANPKQVALRVQIPFLDSVVNANPSCKKSSS